MKYHQLKIDVLDFFINTDGEFRIDVMEIETVDWGGSLLYIGFYGRWEIEILYTRVLFFKLKDWWKHGC